MPIMIYSDITFLAKFLIIINSGQTTLNSQGWSQKQRL